MTEPISIFDLRRKSRNVPVNDGETELTVVGLTAGQICDHLERFPALARISVGGNVDIMDAIKSAPGALCAWIASALAQHANPEAERAVAENLVAKDQANIAQASMALTFSRGFGPFADRLGTLLGNVTVAPGRGQDTRSPGQSRQPPPPPPPPASPGPGSSPLDSSPPSTSSPSEEGSSEKEPA